MDQFYRIKKEKRYSENFGWLERNRDLLEELFLECSNYVRLLEVLNEHGFKGSYSSLLRYLTKNNLNQEKPPFRIETKPGEVAQVDFGYIGRIYDEETKKEVKAYVFVMVLGYSRDAYYEIVKSQDITTWCHCHIHAFEYFGGIPKVIIPDNLKSAIIKASFFEPIANRTYKDLARHYGFQIDPCLPGTPEHKGKVESGVKYVKNNFIPLRTFKNLSDANDQLAKWNETTARVRIHGTTRRKPLELFEAHEKESLISLPANRFEISVWKNLKVYRDIHIQFDKAYYSVPYQLRGFKVWARKTKYQVAVFHENTLVAVHIPAGPGQRRTNYDHYPPDESKYLKYDTDYCLKKAKGIGENAFAVIRHLLKEQPIRYLRSAQNIIRMEKKYGNGRLEAACKRAVFFGNYSYYGIKNILEKELDQEQGLFYEEQEGNKKLDHTFAIDIKKFLKEEATYGNTCEN